ncbi:MAG TPA: lipopolysaccharide heptosyltransferase I [Xanthobacteraceae bacterium]|nr:lipopolysaccharide heptosyltransferase I [Xanthobacteraceae bacterium]
MADILFIKTSSLGDVVHHMPALVDARRAHPSARLSWLVEESFAPLAKLHPTVDEVIPVASRRWRGALGSGATWREMRAFLRQLRARRYDHVVDTQGLLRTALYARLAHGRRHGYDRKSIREPLASAFYDVTYRVARNLHAVARNRILTGQALGYTPDGPPDFGLDWSRSGQPDAKPYAVLLHGTARPEKEWPETRWIAVGQALATAGKDVLVPWGTDSEHARAQRIAERIPGARVPERSPLDVTARMIAGAALVVGADTGLLHLASAFGVPLVAIFVGSEPGLTGPVGAGPIRIVGRKGETPSEAEVLGAIGHVAPGN